MDDIQQSLAVHGDIVRGLPAILPGELHAIVLNFVEMLTGPDDELRVGFLGCEHAGCGEGCGSGSDETAAGDFRIHKRA
jgi:hypothetical protein